MLLGPVFTLLYYKLLIAWMAWIPVLALLGFVAYRVVLRKRRAQTERGAAT